MAPTMTTHYDTLQVHRKASPEVIQAAYKSLCKKYHPDKGKLDPAQAEEMMKAVNEAYAVLSNPVRRMEYDGWIDATYREGKAAQAYQGHETAKAGRSGSYFESGRSYTTVDPGESDSPASGKYRRAFLWSGLIIVAIGFLLFVLMPDDISKNNDQTSGKADQNKSSPADQPSTRPPGQSLAKAPNGLDWPSESGYLKGYPVLSAGYSRLTIDNSKNDYHVHIKLFRVDAKPIAVRHVYVAGGMKFAISNIASGTYEVRYRNLSSGRLSRTERFIMKETKTKTGVGHSNVTLTLYNIPEGNMPLHPIEATDFE